MPPLANAAGTEPLRQKVVAETILGQVDAALEDALNGEPGWAGTLMVEPIELDERNMSAN